ncbi:MAG: glutamate--tRNA ligase [Alphaproteobacteria bacterium]|nr:MAG: glutamate--tRNA ligase [Alphaproteobacteria bacterium]TAF15483.1 MAG: glutamate--tRNA ligase [Alphaproteobacteria bacterium]
MINVRFAPSPTGYVHVGNVRTALMNWLFAKQQGGTFMLRIDDTDVERSRSEYETAIEEDLRWLGLQWDEKTRQSDRMERYRTVQQALMQAGRIYACYETEEELEIKRKMLMSRGKPPMYDRGALSLTDAQKKAYEAEGRIPHYRFLMHDGDVVWNDMIRGEVRFQGQFLGDPVVVRADGVPLFTFASCVDDSDMGITHILRGEDHVSNSAVQMQIFEAMGVVAPQMGHMALLTMKDAKLSKRAGSASIRTMREEGFMPLPLLSYMAKIGTSDAIELAHEVKALIDAFDCTKFGRAPATFEQEELQRLNAKYLHQTQFDEVKGWLEAHHIQITEAFWLTIRANITQLADVAMWWDMIHQPVTPVIEDAEYCTLAASLLPEGVWEVARWQEFIEAMKHATGRKGKALFMPLRLALSAREDGPELPTLFVLLGHDKVKQRLLGMTI